MRFLNILGYDHFCTVHSDRVFEGLVHMHCRGGHMLGKVFVLIKIHGNS